jgi:hypothetical protein
LLSDNPAADTQHTIQQILYYLFITHAWNLSIIDPEGSLITNPTRFDPS